MHFIFKEGFLFIRTLTKITYIKNYCMEALFLCQCKKNVKIKIVFRERKL